MRKRLPVADKTHAKTHVKNLSSGRPDRSRVRRSRSRTAGRSRRGGGRHPARGMEPPAAERLEKDERKKPLSASRDDRAGSRGLGRRNGIARGDRPDQYPQCLVRRHVAGRRPAEGRTADAAHRRKSVPHVARHSVRVHRQRRRDIRFDRRRLGSGDFYDKEALPVVYCI